MLWAVSLGSPQGGQVELSTARDAEVMMETLDALSKRYVGQLPEATFHQSPPVGGPVIDGQAKDAHTHADVLGDEHDLGVLKATLESGRITPPVDLDAVIELRRHDLRGEAVRLGARVYSESPKRLILRMQASWEAGRDESRRARERDPAEIADAVRAAG